MSLIIDLFGSEILQATLAVVIEKIKNAPVDRKERKTYMLKEWSRINDYPLTKYDFQDVLS